MTLSTPRLDGPWRAEDHPSTEASAPPCDMRSDQSFPLQLDARRQWVLACLARHGRNSFSSCLLYDDVSH